MAWLLQSSSNFLPFALSSSINRNVTALSPPKAESSTTWIISNLELHCFAKYTDLANAFFADSDPSTATRSLENNK
jgi:hypothetical protein